ncbi:hypothetical protein D3C73_1513700 [compost metagenome]|jgi:hypothetical protein
MQILVTRCGDELIDKKKVELPFVGLQLSPRDRRQNGVEIHAVQGIEGISNGEAAAARGIV